MSGGRTPLMINNGMRIILAKLVSDEITITENGKRPNSNLGKLTDLFELRIMLSKMKRNNRKENKKVGEDDE